VLCSLLEHRPRGDAMYGLRQSDGRNIFQFLDMLIHLWMSRTEEEPMSRRTREAALSHGTHVARSPAPQLLLLLPLLPLHPSPTAGTMGKNNSRFGGVPMCSSCLCSPPFYRPSSRPWGIGHCRSRDVYRSYFSALWPWAPSALPGHAYGNPS